MDEPSPRGNTGGVYGEDGVEQAGRVSESDWQTEADDFFSEALDGKVEAVEFILQVVLEKIVDLCRIMVIRHV